MTNDSSGQPPVPDWFVSFADMMTLLLTMFVMLLSFSEPKKDDKFNAVVAQLQRQFGKDGSTLGSLSGGVIARHTAIAKAATTTRLKRHAAIMGETFRTDMPVTVARHSSRRSIGSGIFFREGSVQLNAQARDQLRQWSSQLAEQSHTIEICGHLTRDAIDVSASYEDRWEQAFLRSRAVMRYLVDELRLDARRVRIAVGTPAEQPSQSAGSTDSDTGPSVELYLLDEVARQTSASDVP